MPTVTEPNLHQPEAHAALCRRLSQITPSSPRQWGQMDVAQMLAHVTANLDIAMSDEQVKQTLMGHLFGRVAKRRIFRDGIPRGIPTDPKRKITDQRNFQQEKDELERTLRLFHERGTAGITRQPHDFFGKMTPQEWARLQYLHVDHHFRQFST